jgi:hypothetical protein
MPSRTAKLAAAERQLTKALMNVGGPRNRINAERTARMLPLLSRALPGVRVQERGSGPTRTETLAGVSEETAGDRIFHCSMSNLLRHSRIYLNGGDPCGSGGDLCEPVEALRFLSYAWSLGTGRKLRLYCTARS